MAVKPHDTSEGVALISGSDTSHSKYDGAALRTAAAVSKQPPADECNRRQEQQGPPPRWNVEAIQEVAVWLSGAHLFHAAQQHGARGQEHHDDVRGARGEHG